MSKIDVIRAWKDEAYRASLTDAERARLPTHPAGRIELSDAELESVAGGRLYITNLSCTVNDTQCCSSYIWAGCDGCAPLTSC